MTSTVFSTWTSLALLAFVARISAYSPVEPVLWNDSNCRNGNVTDLICCRDDHCENYQNQASCEQEPTCRWTQSKRRNKDSKEECVANRDADNNVCCKSPISDICTAILDGRCPERFQVPSGCCSDKGMVYTGVLRVDKVGYVCCNTPCRDARKLDCEVKDECSVGVSGRSLGGAYDGPHHVNYGFNKKYLPKASYGKYLPYTGFEHRYHHLPTKEHSVVGEVDEITVDDLMTSLVEALSNDKDAYQYSSALHSDPLTGKRKYGGFQGGTYYVDPNYFLEEIYNNPYGNSRGQFGFEGKGWPGVHGYYPQNVRTPYHGYKKYSYSQPQYYGSYGPQRGYYGGSYGGSYRGGYGW